jgi:glycerol kinase
MFNILSQSPRGGGAIEAVDTVRVEKEPLRKATKKHLDSDRTKTSSPLPLIGSIDQGTSSTRFILFSTLGTIVAWSQVEHKQIFPSDGDAVTGWHEHDPLEIWNNVVACIAAVVQAMDYDLALESPLPIGDRVLPTDGYVIKALGITNQRETTIAWNAKTGKTYYNAIVWDDTRTNTVANHLASSASSGSLMAMASGQTTQKFLENDPKDRLRAKTGLPLASYFAGTKVKWLLDHVEELQRDMMTQPENVRFGTIDTWVLYQFTGEPIDGVSSTPPSSPSKRKSFRRSSGNVGGLFLTDVSNASRWLFLDIENVAWDPNLVNAVCSPHNVPLSALPEVRPSSQVYATLRQSSTGIAKRKYIIRRAFCLTRK